MRRFCAGFGWDAVFVVCQSRGGTDGTGDGQLLLTEERLYVQLLCEAAARPSVQTLDLSLSTSVSRRLTVKNHCDQKHHRTTARY